MKRIRFTIGSLIGVIALAALAIAALRESTTLSVQAVTSATGLLFLTSILLSVHRREAARAYWFGFALFGVVYVITSEIPTLQSRLITSPALTFLASKHQALSQSGYMFVDFGAAQKPIQSVAFSPDGRSLAVDMSGSVRIWDAASGLLLGTTGRSPENFVRIGHCLLSLILAVVGGWLSRFLYRRSKS